MTEDYERTLEETIAAHRRGHEKNGQTIAIYLPPDCPWETAEEIWDAIAEAANPVGRDGWDAFVWGHGGDCKLVPEDDDGRD